MTEVHDKLVAVDCRRHARWWPTLSNDGLKTMIYCRLITNINLSAIVRWIDVGIHIDILRISIDILITKHYCSQRLETWTTGNSNSNGPRLLSLCSEQNVTITNTLFKLPDKHKTSWMHPRFKQWHLLDVIVRKSQIHETLVTRVMRNANCWMEHILNLSKVLLKIRPARRRSRGAKKINCDALKDPQKQESFARKISHLIHDIDEMHAVNSSEKCDNFACRLVTVAQEILGIVNRKHCDWLTESSNEIRDLLQEKNMPHEACPKEPICHSS